MCLETWIAFITYPKNHQAFLHPAHTQWNTKLKFQMFSGMVFSNRYWAPHYFKKPQLFTQPIFINCWVSIGNEFALEWVFITLLTFYLGIKHEDTMLETTVSFWKFGMFSNSVSMKCKLCCSSHPQYWWRSTYIWYVWRRDVANLVPLSAADAGEVWLGLKIIM